MSIKKYTFAKNERLKSRKALHELFAEGKRLHYHSFRLLFIEKDNGPGDVKCGVGVQSRFFKRAVDRNRIKRLLRECYRQQQLPVKDYVQQTSSQLSLFILYIGKNIPDYTEVSGSVEQLLRNLLKQLHATNSQDT